MCARFERTKNRLREAIQKRSDKGPATDLRERELIFTKVSKNSMLTFQLRLPMWVIDQSINLLSLIIVRARSDEIFLVSVGNSWPKRLRNESDRRSRIEMPR